MLRLLAVVNPSQAGGQLEMAYNLRKRVALFARGSAMGKPGGMEWEALLGLEAHF